MTECELIFITLAAISGLAIFVQNLTVNKLYKLVQELIKNDARN